MILAMNDASIVIEFWATGLVIVLNGKPHLDTRKHALVEERLPILRETVEAGITLGDRDQSSLQPGAPSGSALKRIAVFRQRIADLEGADEGGPEIVEKALLIGHYRSLIERLSGASVESSTPATGGA